MINDKQSSVEWLYDKLFNCELNIFEWQKHLEHAKVMHKDEIKDAHERGQSDEKDYWNIGDKVGVRFMVKSNEYYKEKFNQ